MDLIRVRVLFDGVVFENSQQRGVQRVLRDLIAHLPSDIHPVIAITHEAKCELPKNAEVVRMSSRATALLPKRLRRFVRDRAAHTAMRRLSESCDLFQSTYYTLPPRPMPTVCYVYDMIIERCIDHFDGPVVEDQVHRKARCIRAADHLLALSQCSADDVEAFYPQVRHRVSVAYPGSQHVATSPSSAPPPHDPQPYALYVGGRGRYKNFSVILDAMATSAWPSHLLLNVIGPPWKANEQLRVDRLTSMGRAITHLGRAGDAALAQRYARAACVIVSSIIEGFGLPIVEAQQAGAPVVAADTPIVHEVAGDSVVRFEAQRERSLALAVTQAIDPHNRAALIHAGSANAARFTWQACADAAARVYRILHASRRSPAPAAR